MFDKTQNKFKSPDLKEMQAVVIDYKTIIYIKMGDDPVKAKARYMERLRAPK
ncbi:MAG: hypothetical protein ACERKD_18025 [Prolixibacteraceae bacterium]